MLTRRFVLTGLIAAPAVIAADKLMPVHSLPKRYATVWGVGHDLEVVEHVIWEPTSVMAFGMSDDMDKFREVTAWEYGFPVEPLPKPVTLPHWHREAAPDPLTRFRVPEGTFDGPFLPPGYTPPKYLLAEHMGPSARVGIWDPDRAAKDDASPTGIRNRYPYDT
jgi:hypothetical protein